ncbi:hypothetical protein HK097_008409 [Rhizophlyctis rosea]|uniref:Uncharacterized protein n=1 Tax=Rhizophlyctis rosea TaxID=64517 RepID=A0AAD5SAF1_9FUNG|nr:hypothetical protein HK097_008409 [Rhizophlyctis rosea]
MTSAFQQNFSKYSKALNDPARKLYPLFNWKLPGLGRDAKLAAKREFPFCELIKDSAQIATLDGDEITSILRGLKAQFDAIPGQTADTVDAIHSAYHERRLRMENDGLDFDWPEMPTWLLSMRQVAPDRKDRIDDGGYVPSWSSGPSSLGSGSGSTSGAGPSRSATPSTELPTDAPPGYSPRPSAKRPRMETDTDDAEHKDEEVVRKGKRPAGSLSSLERLVKGMNTLLDERSKQLLADAALVSPYSDRWYRICLRRLHIKEGCETSLEDGRHLQQKEDDLEEEVKESLNGRQQELFRLASPLAKAQCTFKYQVQHLKGGRCEACLPDKLE